MVRKCMCRVLIAGLLAGSWCGAAMAAEGGPEVTVSISGSLNEMLPVLELLRNMGFGFETPDDTDKALRLEVHSIVRDTDLLKGALGTAPESAGEPARSEETEAAQQPADMSALGLYQGAVEPATAAPGAKVMVSVVVGDPNRVVDTMAARLVGEEGAKADLYDDGTHGDATANDHIWTCSILLPEGMPSGPYHVEITAYDAYGDPVETANGEPLRTRIAVTVRK